MIGVDIKKWNNNNVLLDNWEIGWSDNLIKAKKKVFLSKSLNNYYCLFKK
jgi:hypothetical protein